jgi:hypothetical protein
MSKWGKISLITLGVVLPCVELALLAWLYLDRSRRIDACSGQLSEVTEQRDELSAAVTAANAKIDQLKNSDRIAWENLQQLATDDLYSAQEAYQHFLQTYPGSSYKAQAEAELAKINQLIAEDEKEIEKALTKAAKAKDAVEAFDILSAANERPVSDPRITDALEKVRPEAERLRSERATLRNLGVKVENLRCSYEIRGLPGEELWLPFIKFDVRNVDNTPITDLRISAEFVDRGANELLGDKVTDYVVSRYGGTSELPAGVAKIVFLYGLVGFKSEWAFVGKGPDVVAEVSASRDQKDFVRLETVPVQKPAGYEGFGEE